MHRHDRAGARSDRGLRRVRVQSEALRLHVHEYGTRSERGHGARAREIGEGGHDHLVPGFDPERQERDRERRGPGGNSDRVRDAAGLGKLALEAVVLGPEDELPGAEHALEVADELFQERPMDRTQIQKRDRRLERGHHGSLAVARAMTTG